MKWLEKALEKDVHYLVLRGKVASCALEAI